MGKSAQESSVNPPVVRNPPPSGSSEAAAPLRFGITIARGRSAGSSERNPHGPAPETGGPSDTVIKCCVPSLATGPEMSPDTLVLVTTYSRTSSDATVHAGGANTPSSEDTSSDACPDTSSSASHPQKSSWSWGERYPRPSPRAAESYEAGSSPNSMVRVTVMHTRERRVEELRCWRMEVSSSTCPTGPVVDSPKKSRAGAAGAAGAGSCGGGAAADEEEGDTSEMSKGLGGPEERGAGTAPAADAAAGTDGERVMCVRARGGSNRSRPRPAVGPVSKFVGRVVGSSMSIVPSCRLGFLVMLFGEEDRCFGVVRLDVMLL
mmetsp:Transcript_32425/g.64278  ORF Transcript_32425/g.64278 Transcript_32425/m.64278 type:complete len:320 (-) Transcript_32425:113-1072(-)